MSLHLDAAGGVTPQFADLLVRLVAAYPTAGKLDDETFRSYARILGDVPLRDLVAAIGSRLRRPASADEARFFPSAPQIAAWVRAPGDEAGLLAWAAFRRAADEVGAYRSLELEDAAAGSALLAAFGSWAEYCGMPDGPELYGRRQEFLAAYREARRGARAVPGATRLPGLCEGLGRYLGGSTASLGRITAAGEVGLVADGRRQLKEAETA